MSSEHWEKVGTYLSIDRENGESELEIKRKQTDERQKIEWALQAKKLLLQLEKRQALPRNYPYSRVKLNAEIAAVEELINSCWLLFANERLQSC
jgi:hypothetical protein